MLCRVGTTRTCPGLSMGAKTLAHVPSSAQPGLTTFHAHPASSRMAATLSGTYTDHLASAEQVSASGITDSARSRKHKGSSQKKWELECTLFGRSGGDSPACQLQKIRIKSTRNARSDDGVTNWRFDPERTTKRTLQRNNSGPLGNYGASDLIGSDNHKGNTFCKQSQT